MTDKEILCSQNSFPKDIYIFFFLSIGKSSKNYSIEENQNLSSKFRFYNEVEATISNFTMFRKKNKNGDLSKKF